MQLYQTQHVIQVSFLYSVVYTCGNINEESAFKQAYQSFAVRSLDNILSKRSPAQMGSRVNPVLGRNSCV